MTLYKINYQLWSSEFKKWEDRIAVYDGKTPEEVKHRLKKDWEIIKKNQDGVTYKVRHITVVKY